MIVVAFVLALAVLAGAGSASAAGDGARAPATARHMMVAAADARAVEAGLDVLRAGGSAADAAVAVQLVLNLVEPQNSGIGGGGFLLYFDAASGEVTTYDGRETAPAAAGGDLFLKADGTPMGFYDALVGGRAVGVPGTLRLLERVHADHGRRAWADLFKPAIRLAEEGFEISPQLAAAIARARALDRFAATRDYFFAPDGTPKPAGTRLRNPAFAETLRSLAAGGADAFYRGAIARDIVAAVRGAPGNPGLMSEADLAGYVARRRPPVCLDYRAWTVCGMGPPTSGGLTVLQTLGILENFDLAALAPGSVAAVHLISEASRLAYADRARYMADADFVEVPVDGLLDKLYLRGRASRIRADSAMSEAVEGFPPVLISERAGPRGRLAAAAAGADPFATTESTTTTHFSIVDAEGNAVAMTSSIEQAFGSRLMVRGFLLNQQLTDFSFRPDFYGLPIANRVEPNKRPRSSMSPTLVFDQRGRLYMTLGSPGGPLIIDYVVQTLIAVLDWGLDMQAAISLPRHAARRGPIRLEAGTSLEALKGPLEALGHEVRMMKSYSGLYGIRVTPDGLEGGADPRREGIARGE